MNPINTILLHPTDVLFFRDGRPMEGSLAGHGAAWPLPNVTDAAFHAALHRSGLNGHAHDQRRGAERHGKDNRRFGSLVTAGPFPVQQRPDGQAWFFPRPLDLADSTLTPALLPTATFDSVLSSLPDPLEYAVANRLPPSKDNPAKAWLSAAAYSAYLHNTSAPTDRPDLPRSLDDSAFSDAEATVGIAIDAETGTTGQGEAAGKIYSARYLRLRDDWCLGVFAKTNEKNDSPDKREDLIPNLVNEQKRLLVGGQQRLCTAELLPTGSCPPLPRGKTDGFACHDNGGKKRWLVKWILLSPALWPEIPEQAKDGRPMTPHCGGWLPNWVRQSDGQVMLRCGQPKVRDYSGKHTRGFSEDSKAIAAHLVAAIVPKPIPVTGWALANGADRDEGGAKSTHLAVPAGAVYYFEAEPDKDGGPGNAVALAAALNWHGSESNPTTIKNRRSTLIGEKGFGLGVCGTWQFYEAEAGR